MAASLFVLPGCAATSMTLGVSEPEVSAIQLGQTRGQVEKILGERLWRLGSSEGVTYDIYQFEKAQRARPVAGLATFLMDYITLGLFEGMVADCKEGEWVKQIGIGYDDGDTVRFVSEPWGVGGGGPCRRMRSLVPAASGLPLNAKPAPVADPERRASERATLEIESGINVLIDDRRVDGPRVDLRAGRHTLSHDTVLGGSVMYGATIFRKADTFADLHFAAGRLYRLQTERFYCVNDRVIVFWLDDVDSGEVLACSLPAEREEPKDYAVPPGKANVYIYRNESFGSLAALKVFIDDVFVGGTTGSKSYIVRALEPGTHTIVSRSETEGDAVLSIAMEAGKTYFVWQEVKIGVWGPRSALHRVSDEEGKSSLVECRRVN